MLRAKVSKVVSTLIRMKANVLTVQKGPHDLYFTPLVIATVFSPIVFPAILTLLQPQQPPSFDLKVSAMFPALGLHAWEASSYPPD